MSKRIEIRISVLVGLVLGVSAGAFAWGYGYYAGHLTRVDKQLDAEGLSQVYRLLQQKFDGRVDAGKLRDGAKLGLAAATGDPYTVYLSAQSAKAMNDDLNGTLSGIGAEVGIKNQKLVIISPIDGAPAAKAGLRAGDQVIKINDEDPSSLTLDQAVQKIRGPKGSQVKLTVIRGTGTPFDITIARDQITVPSVKWSLKPGNIGYIQITQFGPDTAKLVDQAASELSGQGAQQFILDLRNDPGGYLDAAVKVASEWVGQGRVVEERRGATIVQQYNASGNGKLIGDKTVVLINEGSASASEIVAGALQDHHAATLVGEKSFGKGSVQEIEQLSGGAELKVTVAHWYTPNGKNINKAGIQPDVTVKLDQSDYNASRDPQLEKALSSLSQ